METERFRLRHLVERLVELNHVDVVEDQMPLAAVSQRLDGNPRAVWFRNVGPEGAELVGNVVGSRERVAVALGVEEERLFDELVRRTTSEGSVVEIPSDEAPVHQVVLEGDDADLTTLPVHVQHELDGGPYISASIDFSVDPDSGETNIGFRRMMLRGPREAGINLHSPSDLRAIYQKAIGQGKRLPVSFVVGCHPADSLTAVQRIAADELNLLSAFRAETVPVVKCVTNDIRVPADAEYVLEGYLDEHGYSEDEGPYGEFMGYYGRMKQNPVFHLTAITRREDALFQTVTISGRHLGLTDTAILGSLVTETTVHETLKQAVREPTAIYATESGNGTHNVRVAIRQRSAGEARNAIAAVLGSVGNIKHVFVVDDDIDVYDDAQMEWALSTRFQGEKDLVIMSGMRVIPLDPSLEGRLIGSKVGFDLTLPYGVGDAIQTKTAEPINLQEPPQKFSDVTAALSSGPMTFVELMQAVSSDDGREVVRALDGLRQEGRLERVGDGQYSLRS